MKKSKSILRTGLFAFGLAAVLAAPFAAFPQDAPSETKPAEAKPADTKSQPAKADEGKPTTGDEVMARVRENEYSESLEATIQMTLIDKNGKAQARRFQIQRNNENVLIRFLYPPDIKDTGYLILKDEKGESQIYVYFPPPTDDYRQINVEEDGSSQSFLGSDFDITDFQIRNPEETTNTLVGMEKVAGIDCYVVESVPKDPNYKYSKVVSWIRSDYYLPIQIKFYDRKGELVKDMKVYKFKSVGDKKVISKSEMSNKTNDHKTVLELEEIQFDVTFPDDNFTIRRLTQP